MTQKDKVKELVGRGLHSYHTKALQQMDRIEKKNKEQNHKISILTNELDNDYLTKTEEGSVISLEHSKEGMVYLDELQGNTLVNYCTDGSKEMTLNGDIDVEGTFVTTTEGVDNGLVDVMCEGNTLVNIANVGSDFLHKNVTSWYRDASLCEISSLKLNQEYTFIIEKEYLDNHNNNFNEFQVGIGDLINTTIGHPTMTIVSGNFKYNNDKIEKKVVVVRFTDFKDGKYLSCRPARRNTAPVEGESANYHIKVTILEGDWTNKEIPPYFEGMKSVGECEGNKIEILSQNKNLLDETTIVPYQTSSVKKEDGWYVCDDGNYGGIRIGKAFLKKGVQYYLNFEYENISNGGHWCVPPIGTTNYAYLGGNVGMSLPQGIGNKSIKLGIPNEDCYIDCMVLRSSTSGTIKYRNISITTEPTTSYVKYSLNKKEISLNEPLRGLPSGVKDYFIKQGGKWYIQRNVGEYIFKGNEINSSQGSVNETNLLYWNNAQSTLKNKTNVSEVLSDKLPHGKQGTSNTKGIEGISFNGTGQNLLVDVKKTMAETNEFLKDSKITYQLETPIYEEITDVELITYLDVTHISNNSIIPCNMKIINSGYNAIIKPSTQYTVALDTNKNGTIGINLGGAKVTTTNNVATITTPATLTDDILRLYGKGIKGSKVRILEGDKTNWIPSYFEGMKSSFEDKFDTTDNTYKMEILSNNKNLFDITKVPNMTTVENLGDCLKITGYANDLKVVASFLTPNKNYTTSTTLKEIQGTNNGLAGNIRLYNPKTGHWITSKTFIAPQNIKDYSIFLYGMQGNPSECIVSNIQIFEGNEVSLYTPHKSNKIQFSSIEPLRKWDRFVFKDGQLMIERGSGIYTYTGKESWNYETTGTNSGRCFSYIPNLIVHDKYEDYVNNEEVIADKFATSGFPIGNGGKFISPNTICGYKNSNIYIFPSIDINTKADWLDWLSKNTLSITYKLAEPTYEEIPFELQKIILEGYENGTLFFDTNIPPTSTITYAGETPIVKATKLNKTEVLNNTNDINDNIVPYLMDMDYRVVCLQLQSDNINDGVSMARLFGGAYEMLQRDILSKRYSVEEYKYRLDAYLSVNKITEKEYEKLGDMLNE